jgi:hypothetical protein
MRHFPQQTKQALIRLLAGWSCSECKPIRARAHYVAASAATQQHPCRSIPGAARPFREGAPLPEQQPPLAPAPVKSFVFLSPIDAQTSGLKRPSKALKNVLQSRDPGQMIPQIKTFEESRQTFARLLARQDSRGGARGLARGIIPRARPRACWAAFGSQLAVA